jgi:hypothetical protein
MRQSGPSNHQAKRRNVAVAVFVAIAALFIYQQVSSAVVEEPQRRQRQTRRRPSVPTSQKGADKYSNFTHQSHGKNAKDPRARNLKCDDCHTIPSAAAPDRIAASTKTSAISGYPYHDSCLRCHQKEFYRGDRPAICSVCHTRVAVRLTSRDVYPKFPSPKRGDIMAREFPGYYPHGLHQSLMALDRQPVRDMNTHFVSRRVSFSSVAPDKTPPKDICASCHFADERAPMTLPLQGIQSDNTFKRIEADTFRTIPGVREVNAHASCFNCHWEAQKPTKDDCNGCHLSRADYTARKLEVTEPPALSPNAIRWFESWPVELPKRFSLKFRHDTHSLSSDGKTETNNHDVGCTTCHINIAQMTTLNIPKADVQIISCAPCHATTSKISVGQGDGVTIFDEMTLKADNSKSYTCIACHTTVIGREPPPCTHYSVIGQPCPKPRQSGEK